MEKLIKYICDADLRETDKECMQCAAFVSVLKLHEYYTEKMASAATEAKG